MGNYVVIADIDNWPSGMTTAEMNALIAKCELYLEELTDQHFYTKNFDIEINGNGKNRIFPPLRADIISVSAVYLCSIELEVSWYAWDADSVYLDLCQSAAAATGIPWGELYYRLGEADERGLFPRGYNNIRIVGTYGQSELLALAKQVTTILVESHNDGSLHPVLMKAEKIGDYSYQHGGTLYGNIYTGIRAADEVIDLLMRNKPTIMTP